MATKLVVPDRQLEAEGDRLGMDSVRATNHHRVAVLDRFAADGLGQYFDIAQEQVDSLDNLQRQSGVDDVGTREAKVNVARVLAHSFAGRTQERDDVVISLFLD